MKGDELFGVEEQKSTLLISLEIFVIIEKKMI
jgi:hypothetical protein